MNKKLLSEELIEEIISVQKKLNDIIEASTREEIIQIRKILIEKCKLDII